MTIEQTDGVTDASNNLMTVTQPHCHIRGSLDELNHLILLIREACRERHRGLEGVTDDILHVSVWCDCDHDKPEIAS